MKDLIKALTILSKYPHDEDNPTHCEHDVLHVAVDPNCVSDEDKKELDKLSFTPDDWDGFSSYRFGSF